MGRNAVLAVDGSEAAQNAVDYVRNAFEAEEYKVFVATVVPKVPDYMDRTLESHQDDVTDTLSGAGEEYTQDVVAELEASGFRATPLILQGHPGEELCRVCEERDADVAVMGRRGLGAVEELLLGSVSQFVVHHAPCPVTLVPGPGERS